MSLVPESRKLAGARVEIMGETKEGGVPCPSWSDIQVPQYPAHVYPGILQASSSVSVHGWGEDEVARGPAVRWVDSCPKCARYSYPCPLPIHPLQGSPISLLHGEGPGEISEHGTFRSQCCHTPGKHRSSIQIHLSPTGLDVDIPCLSPQISSSLLYDIFLSQRKGTPPFATCPPIQYPHRYHLASPAYNTWQALLLFQYLLFASSPAIVDSTDTVESIIALE